MSHSTVLPSLFNRKNPFASAFLENRRLSKDGSAKDTRHFSLSLDGSGMSYVPGDALGVYAKSDPMLVREFLELLSLDPATTVTVGDSTSTLEKELTHNFVLNRLNKKFAKLVADKLPPGSVKDHFASLCSDEAMLDDYVSTRDHVDLLLEARGAKLSPEDILASLAKNSPRLYSIASSHDAHPGEVHLTVAVVQYTTHGRTKRGLVSGYLAHHLPIGETVPIFVQPTRHFHMPPNGDTAMIMVGPGTGIAPFRAFLEQREHDGATGKTWLFFGDRRASSDFLYEEELKGFQKRGILHRFDTAFSRDQAEKIYVQNRMQENAAAIWKWIQDGAWFYVCGDAKRMAKDVHQTLIDIVQKQGGMDAEAAAQYVNVTMTKTEGRYLKDVY